MEQLPSVLLQVVLSKVSAPDCARAACVARLWHFVAHQELQWKSYCQSDFQLYSLVDPFGRPCASWKV